MNFRIKFVAILILAVPVALIIFVFYFLVYTNNPAIKTNTKSLSASLNPQKSENNLNTKPVQAPVSTRAQASKAAPVKTVKKMWGVYASPSAGNIADFEKMVGSSANMQAIFVGWQDNLPYLDAKSKNKTLVVFWEPTNILLDDIASGNYDSYISQFADEIKSYKGPVILIPMAEMNGGWDTWDGTYGNNTPAKIISAWKHIHDLFSGIDNVKFGWDVNNDSVPDTPGNAITNYYPGTEYVDYVGVDGFNFGNPWQTYSDVFSNTLEKLKAYQKPIYIFSMACAESPQKSLWITDALSQIKNDPNITGFIWFNENKEQDWLINSDSASLIAFKNAISNW